VLYSLFFSLLEEFKVFNVIRYISFRSGLAAITSFLFVLIAGGPFIAWMKQRQFGQAIRTDGPQTHLKKGGTPTMGGLLILVGSLLGTLFWSDLSNIYVWALCLLIVIYGMVGFLDDYIKIIKKDPEGLASRWKFRLLFVGAALVSFLIYAAGDGQAGQGVLYFPFFKK
jgi:phospho-N-acetylmuramoyl-pentapeptide-transferase